MKSIVALIFVLAIFSQPACSDESPPFVEIPATHETIVQLRKGGYVLYMRHGNSDTTRPDRVPNVDLNDCSTQRPLTEEGKKVAASVGEAIRKVKIPVGEVFVSPMCRTKDTALAAFGPNFTVLDHLQYTANLTNEEKATMMPKTRALLSKPVMEKTNRVLVAHAPNLMDIMGYFPRIEGTIVVLKPLDDKGFEYLGSIVPQQWPALFNK